MKQTDFGMPIYNLQRMLRMIFQVKGMEPEVIPDGIFNITTENAVKAFQRMKHIEDSGVVDNETWDRIVEEYELAVIEGKPPACVQLFVREDFETAEGEGKARISVLQAMLQVMHKRFSNLPYVEITGIYDAQTNNALRIYRELFYLPQGEGMDNLLWYHFAKAYESSVLPHDFENPENNGFKPEEARQQIDLSRRSETSMPDMLTDELLRQPSQVQAQERQTPLNRMPMLDSYQSIRRAREEEGMQSADGASVTGQAAPNTEAQNNNGRQNRPPLKWKF